jgi:hypothetical protein
MRNFELLEEIANRRQIGYTTKISSVKDVKILCSSNVHARNLNQNFNTKKFVSTSIEKIRGDKICYIPDNSFLYNAVNEARNKIDELTLKLQQKTIKQKLKNLLEL